MYFAWTCSYYSLLLSHNYFGGVPSCNMVPNSISAKSGAVLGALDSLSLLFMTKILTRHFCDKESSLLPSGNRRWKMVADIHATT